MASFPTRSVPSRNRAQPIVIPTPEAMLVQVLREYRMMPWSELARGSRRHQTRVVHGPRGGQRVQRPDYAAPVPEDQTWFEWAREFYAPVWERVLAVV